MDPGRERARIARSRSSGTGDRRRVAAVAAREAREAGAAAHDATQVESPIALKTDVAIRRAVQERIVQELEAAKGDRQSIKAQRQLDRLHLGP